MLVVFLLAPVLKSPGLPDHDIEGEFALPVRMNNPFEAQGVAGLQTVYPTGQGEFLLRGSRRADRGYGKQRKREKSVHGMVCLGF